jgi:outer membrane protein assembly factor BamE (lipoprotein component of BamABCDE complex)
VRRRKLLLGLAAAAVIAVGVVVLCRPQDQLPADKLARLRTGMSRTEVVGVLGAPGNYATGPLVFRGNEVYDLSNIRGTVFDDRLCWITDTVVVEVQFDDQGRVTSFGSVPCRPLHPYFDDLLRRARRLWRRWFP